MKFCNHGVFGLFIVLFILSSAGAPPALQQSVEASSKVSAIIAATEAIQTLCQEFSTTGQVDSAVLQAAAEKWRLDENEPTWDDRFDLDGDGVITIADIMLVTQAWGQECAIIPPDPADVAPQLDPTVATNLYAATTFLYSGPDTIQFGVDPNDIQPHRVAVIRGKVTDAAANPLPGVTVRVRGRPEYGYTRTRADGWFDLAVNGGGLLTVDYQLSGYLPAQRQIEVPWQDYVHAPDVALIVLDEQATAVDLSAGQIHVHRASTILDDDGERAAVLLVPAATSQVTVTLPKGSTQVLQEITIRATEYTVGDSGPAAMPGDLPANVAYTYAVELSVDEAIAVGATRVDFDEPLINYVDNFLEFDAGEAVPSAYYDRERSQWVPAPNGLVVAMVGVTDGLADLDVTGDGNADDAATLAAHGITEAERAELTTLYQPGDSFWRVPVAHFSAWDYNWPFGLPPDGVAPRQPRPRTNRDPAPVDRYNLCESIGSFIECQTQTLRDDIPIAGSDQALHYSSSRTQARGPTLQVFLTGEDALPASLDRIELEITVAGQRHSFQFAPAPNLVHEFTWDGHDAYGRAVQGVQRARVRLGYTYPGVYGTAADTAQSFGRVPANLTGNRTRQEITVWQEWEDWISAQDGSGYGVGGWSLTAHHMYHPTGRLLFLGDGSWRSADSVVNIITTVAGTGNFGSGGDGGPATQANVQPVGLAVGPDGSLYITDAQNHRVRRVDPDGIITTVAGTGSLGYNGDGIPATSARLSNPHDVAVGPDGSLYIADYGNHRVRRVGPDGIITTVAGTGSSGFSGDEGPATEARLRGPISVAVGPDGSLYIADFDNRRVRRVGPDGIIHTVAGTGTGNVSGDGGPATEAAIHNPSNVAIGPDGSFYIATGGILNTVNRIRRVGLDGIINTVAGTGWKGYGGDGGLATEALLDNPFRIAVGSDGTLYISDSGNLRVRAVNSDGVIITMAGSGIWGFYGDGSFATGAEFGSLSGVAVGPDGSIYVSDGGNRRVRRVTPPMDGFSGNEILISSEDGHELYVFDPDGRHQQTLHTLTGATLWSFDYNSDGRLIAATDGAGNVITIERNTENNPTAIIAFGQRTELSVDANGFLASVTHPTGEMVQFSYTDEGLLTEKIDARGHSWQYTYDDWGRLIQADDPAGGFQILTRVQTMQGYEVTRTTALGRETRYAVELLPAGGERWTNTFPDGTQIATEFSPDGTRTITLPDGTVTTLALGPDPRFGLQAPAPVSFSVVTAGGRNFVQEMGRSVELTDPSDPLTLETLTETVTVDGRTSTIVYDAATQTFTETSPEGRQLTWSIDALGRIVTHQVGGMAATSYTYNDCGRLAAIIEGAGDPAARTTQFAYDSESCFLISVTDPVGHTTTLDLDASGRVTRLTRPDAAELLLAYDANSNITGVTPPGRPTHIFTYTLTNLMQTHVPPAVDSQSTPVEYAYNQDRQITGVVEAGAALTLTYDLDTSYPASLVLARGTLTQTYDGQGRIAQISDPSGIALDLSYDAWRVTEEVWSGPVGGSVQHTYDGESRLISLSVNGANPITRTYDNDGLLTHVGALTLTRSLTHGLIAATVLGEVEDDQTYNIFGEPVAYTATAGVTELLSFVYERDALGRIAELTQQVDGEGASFAFTYDNVGRLTQVHLDGVLLTEYTYDANGNRIGVEETGSAAIAATYDAQDRLVIYGDATFTYTGGGRLASRTENGDTTTYSYDELGNLLAVTLPDGTEIEYLVDGTGRRIGKRVDGSLVQGFLYRDQLNPVAELDATGDVVSRFVYGAYAHVPDYMLRDGKTYRLLTDHVGSVRLVVEAETGDVVQRLDYDFFGRVLEDTNPGFQPFGFAGGLYDPDTGLVHFGARDYDPETGRWTARDPLEFAGGSTNLYAYADNDPVNRFDPEGLFSMQFKAGEAAGEVGCHIQCSRIAAPCEALGIQFDLAGCVEFCTGRINDALDSIRWIDRIKKLPGHIKKIASIREGWTGLQRSKRLFSD